MKFRKHGRPAQKAKTTSRALHQVTLARALSKLGIASRSQAAVLIAGGHVLVNGRRQTNPAKWVNLATDTIVVQGKAAERKKILRYVLFNKPSNVVTSRVAEKGQMTVYDFLGREGEGLHPAGRLDKDTTGLLVLSNDNRLTNFLTSPDAGLEKTYVVTTERELTIEERNRLMSGVEIIVDGRPYRTQPAKVRKVAARSYEIVIQEGKNRQIRKMVEALGTGVVDLRRTAVGPLALGNLREASWREMHANELEAIRGRYGVHRQEKP